MTEKDNLLNADGSSEVQKNSAENLKESSKPIDNNADTSITKNSDEKEVKAEESLDEISSSKDTQLSTDEDKTAQKPSSESSEEKQPTSETTEVETPTVSSADSSEIAQQESVEEVATNEASTKPENKSESEKISESKKVKKEEKHVEEIEDANAEDAEDEDNVERHNIQSKDYHSMDLEALANEFDKLLKGSKIQTIKSQVDDIRSEFKSKFDALLDEKKEEFLNEGGNEIDFYFSSPIKKRFNSLYKTYKEGLSTYYKNREANLKANLDQRLEIIEEIKSLINVEEDINTTYKHFKELQERWRNSGPIPREKYNNTWNNYHHHVENFYDFLHLNRDLRDMDFKHNLDQKLKIIERAEELAADDNVNRAFRELQILHKMWKEDLGPVGKEHREEVWERFSNATKAIHDKRQAYYADLDKAYEANLERKEIIIDKIKEVTEQGSDSHQNWQKKIKQIEKLRQDFFDAGKVPKKVTDATWTKFKNAVRTFNRSKNAFYKNLKKDQYDNLKKKQDLIQIAEDNKDSDDFATVTPLMKKIQNDWKKIGHVPRKESDKIWKQFKKACNHYFDRFHEQKRQDNKELYDAFDKKVKILDSLKDLKLEGKPKKDQETIKELIEQWKDTGHVPHHKRYIEGKFNKAIDELFNALKMDREEIEMIKYENKLESLQKPDTTDLLDNEHNFIRKKIDEVKAEINQLENNMQFFSNVDDNNPLLKEVVKNLDRHKSDLHMWEEKLRKLKGMY